MGLMLCQIHVDRLHGGIAERATSAHAKKLMHRFTEDEVDKMMSEVQGTAASDNGLD